VLKETSTKAQRYKHQGHRPTGNLITQFNTNTMYYIAKVRESHETDRGTIKAKTVQFLVEDEAISGVEAQINKEYKGSTFDWELTSVSETKIEKILEAADRGDRRA